MFFYSFLGHFPLVRAFKCRSLFVLKTRLKQLTTISKVMQCSWHKLHVVGRWKVFVINAAVLALLRKICNRTYICEICLPRNLPAFGALNSIDYCSSISWQQLHIRLKLWERKNSRAVHSKDLWNTFPWKPFKEITYLLFGRWKA